MRALSEHGITKVTKDSPAAKLSIDSFFNSHYKVGEEDLKDLDRIGLAVMGLHSARVLSNMSTSLLPKGKVSDWIRRKILGRVSIGITTLHLAVRSIRDGYFPLIWLASVLTCLALIAIQIFAPQDFRIVPSLWAPAGILVVLLCLPSLWFGRLAKLRWAFWIMFFALPLLRQPVRTNLAGLWDKGEKRRFPSLCG